LGGEGGEGGFVVVELRRTRKTRAQLCLSVGQQSEASAKAVSFSSFSPHPQHKKLLGFSTADCGPYQAISTPAAIFLRSARFLTDLLVEIVGRMHGGKHSPMPAPDTAPHWTIGPSAA